MLYRNRSYVIILSIALMLCFSGCGNNSQKTSNGSSEIPTLTWYNYGPQVRELDDVFTEVSNYTENKIGARVKAINISGAEWAQKMGLIMASNEKFDMCFTASYQSFFSNTSKNCYMELDQLLEDYGQDLKALLPAYTWESATVKGKIYAVPAYKDNAYRYSIAYNKKIIEDLGFNVENVNKLSDLEPCLEAFKAENPNFYPLRLNSRYTLFGTLGFIDLSGGVGYSIYDDSAKIINIYETPEAKEYFELMNKWYKKEYIRPDVATATDDVGVGAFAMTTGQMLPYQRQIDNLSRLPEQQMDDINICEPFMTGSDGSMMAISRTSSNPAETMKFINLLNTDPYLRNLVAYGIEDRHYVKVGENHYKWPEGVTKRDDNNYFSYPFAQGNMYLTLTIEGTPDDIWEKYKEFDNNAIKSHLFGFSFDESNVKTEVSALININKEYMIPLITGASDPSEYLPKALDKMKTAGIDRVIEEINKQLDEWKKN